MNNRPESIVTFHAEFGDIIITRKFEVWVEVEEGINRRGNFWDCIKSCCNLIDAIGFVQDLTQDHDTLDWE